MSGTRPQDIKRHYLPAAAIGYFAADQSPERPRDRVVWVLRKDTDTPRQSSASSVGFEKSIYGYGKGPLFDHDDYFKSGETKVHTPVDNIMRCDMLWAGANDWVQLAQYIAELITRGPDLEQGIEGLAKKGWPPDQIGVGYPLNAQRTSAAILRARWEFVWSPDRDFVLGDRGVTGIYHPRWKTSGYFMPLRKNFGVMLGPAPYKKTLRWSNDTWHIEIDSTTVTADGTDKLNQIMWYGARREIYGSSREQLLQVKEAASAVPRAVQRIAPEYEGAKLLGLAVEDRMKDELLLISLIGGIKEPGEDGPFFLTI